MGELIQNYSEPMYDDVELEIYREQGIRELVKGLFDYSNRLCEKIAELRKEVNKLDYQLSLCNKNDMKKHQDPYMEEYGDIYEDFSGFYVYEEFKDELTESNE
jgi:hypothetical protein